MTQVCTKNGTRQFYLFEKNGLVGRIKAWSNGNFGTTFRFAGKTRRNSFSTFDAAYEYLDSEFTKLDRNTAESSILYPVRHDLRTYHELEHVLRESGNGATLREAVDFYVAHNRRSQFKPRTVNECCEKFLTDTQGSPSHMKTLLRHLGHLKRSFGNRKIDEITADDITQWLRTHPKPEGGIWSAKTQKGVKGSIAALSLYSRDHLHAICTTGKTAFQLAKPDRAPKRPAVEIYSPDQLRALLNQALEDDIDLIPAIVVGAFQGLRPDEFHAENAREEERRPLAWEAFIWNDNILHVTGQKVRSADNRDIPLHKATQEWIAPFREQTGEIWQWKKAFDRRMKRLCVKAEVPRYFDGFRHSYASYRIRVLKHDYDTLASEMGNSRNEILKSYRRLVKDQQAADWFAVLPPPWYAQKVKSALEKQLSAKNRRLPE